MQKLYICKTKDGELDRTQLIAKAQSKAEAIRKFKREWTGAKEEDVYEIHLDDSGVGTIGDEEDDL